MSEEPNRTNGFTSMHYRSGDVLDWKIMQIIYFQGKKTWIEFLVQHHKEKKESHLKVRWIANKSNKEIKNNSYTRLLA